MCGLSGILFADSTVTPNGEFLQSSVQRLHHRGPDSQGIHAAEGVGLVHCRLSLVDLSSRSNQPFWDESGRYCLVYNGEIYNFKKLRSELEARNVVFRTTGDTEVLLQCLINNEAELVLPRLEGMFAFALYDKEEQSLLLARDRFGMKPLYVYEGDGIFAFASEIKAMRPWVSIRYWRAPFLHQNQTSEPDVGRGPQRKRFHGTPSSLSNLLRQQVF